MKVSLGFMNVSIHNVPHDVRINEWHICVYMGTEHFKSAHPNREA